MPRGTALGQSLTPSFRGSPDTECFTVPSPGHVASARSPLESSAHKSPFTVSPRGSRASRDAVIPV